jgi:Domain of unknown function (DUF1835)
MHSSQSALPSRRVNVIQGHSAAGSLRQAIHPQPGELLVNEDVLSCGPLPPFRSTDEWIHLRRAYWDSVAEDDSEGSFNGDLLANDGLLRELDSIVLWLGMGAAEQLLLAWVVQLLKLIESRAQIHVIQFAHMGQRNVDAWGLGLLNPGQLKNHPSAVRLSEHALSDLERLWARVTSSDPAGLLSVLSEPTQLPHSRASLQSLVYRYPDYRTGLGRWESELLSKVKEKGPKVTRVIGHTMGQNLDADLVGDFYLFSRLRRLADSDIAHPLVKMSGNPTSLRDCEVALTDVGASVLAAQANCVELNGIDDWILGVHLDSRRGAVWYQKDGTLVAR